MGSWGVGIEESDTVKDVIETYVDRLRSTQRAEQATAETLRVFAHLFSEANADPDELAHARIGLALAQWRFETLEPALLDEVRADLVARRGIDSHGDAAERERVLRAFVAKLAKPNPKPRAFPKAPRPPLRPHKPKLAAFEAGDCLALQLPSGAYRAALVLVRDQSSETEEFNVIARLDWRGAQPPPSEVFVEPRQLSIAMYPAAPYKASARVFVLGRLEVDPGEFRIEKMPDYWPWQFVRPGRSGSPLPWNGWEDLAGRLPD